MTNQTWNRLPNGDRQAAEHPIRLIKPFSRRAADAGWLVKVPLERDPNFADGWHWTAVTNPTYNLNRGGMFLEGSDYNEARALVAEHLEYILTQIPDDYGQPEPAPEPALIVEDCSVPVLPAENPPAPAPELVRRKPVLIDYDYTRRVGFVDEWDPETGRLVLEIRDPDAKALLNGQTDPDDTYSTGVLIGVVIRTTGWHVPAEQL